MDRRDLDVGLEDAEATFDVGEGLVARNDLGRRDISRVCQHRQLAVEEFGLPDRRLVNGVAEPVGVQVGLDEAGELRVGEGVGEPAIAPCFNTDYRYGV